MLKNDTLKNGTSRLGLYGSAPPGLYVAFSNLSHPGVHSKEMPRMEVPLGWVAIFELRFGDGSLFLPSGITISIDFQVPV